MINFKKELITPELAKCLLANNINNRSKKEARVSFYAKEMKEGRWKEDTGETIKIAKNGLILDGQHRLFAIVKANVPIFMHIAYGLDNDVFSVIDTGIIRSSRDVFKISGVTNYNHIPSIITTYTTLNSRARKNNQKTLSNAEILDIFNSDVFFWEQIAFNSVALYRKFNQILPASVIGGFLSVLIKIDNFKAYDFLNQLCTGENISNSSIYLLRSRLISEKVSTKRHNMNLNYKHALIIKSWNYFYKGKDLKVLKFDIESEAFPQIEGL